MKALTLTQPWATLVAIGAKRIETRSWGTGYRGPLLIHAAKGMPRRAVDVCREEPFATVLQDAGLSPSDLPRGMIVARCRVETVVPTEAMRSFLKQRGRGTELAFGDYGPGRWAWRLADIEALPVPIAARGALGLWEFDDRLLGAAMRETRESQ